MIASESFLAELATIFLGAFFDATLGFCFFVFGEAFFLMAGALFFTTGSVLPLFAALSGAYLADQFGYFIGSRFQRRVRGFMLRNRKRRSTMRRALSLLNKRGVFIVAISRLMGPIAWIMPALVGTLGFRYRAFAAGSAIGVVLGVGLFLTAGWFGAWAAENGGFDIRAFAEANFWTIILLGQAAFLASAFIAQFVSRRLLHRI